MSQRGKYLEDGAITTAKIADAAVDESKLGGSVAGNGLSGGAGSALSISPASLLQGGAVELDGDKVDIDLSLVNVTPSTAPAEVDDAAQLSAVLKGIDNALGEKDLLVIVDAPGTEATTGDTKVVIPMTSLDGFKLTSVVAHCVESGLGGDLTLMVENIKSDDLRTDPTAPNKVEMLTAPLSLLDGAISGTGSVKGDADALVAATDRLRVNILSLGGASPAPKGLSLAFRFTKT